MSQEMQLQDLQEEIKKTRIEITLLSISNNKKARKELKRKVADQMRLLKNKLQPLEQIKE